MKTIFNHSESFCIEKYYLKKYLSKNEVGPDSVDILRLDKLHPIISGNKWFKLKYNIEYARKQGFSELLTCGGIHSNHLHAVACAGQYFDMPVRALVRGYKNLPLTPTLLDCQAMGMMFEFVDKKTYLNRYDPIWCQQQANHHHSYWVPEGGNNELGKKGCEDIVQGCLSYDEVWLSIGSGCTFAGIEQSLPLNITLKGVMAIKGGETLGQSLIEGAVAPARCLMDYDSHWGGFGRCPDTLVDFIQQHDELGLPLDPVYTAKLMWSFEKAWSEGCLDTHKKYLIIHSGGLQGRRGIKGL
jgi:1-aminocyclopropane-1-carboxylate deaminase